MKKIILILTFFLMSSLSFAEDGCGVTEAGTIKAYSGEICEQDLSVTILYSLLGSLYDDFVFKWGYISDISSEQFSKKEGFDLDYYERMSIIFTDIFTAMNFLLLIILGLLLPYYVIGAIINTAKDGEFLGKGWDTTKTATRMIVGVFLLVPVKGVLILQIIILNLSVWGIAGGNFIWGGFLNYMQYSIPHIAEVGNFEDSIPQITSEDELSLYWDYALLDFKKITKIAMCRDRSSQYILDKQIENLKGSKLEDSVSCNAPPVTSISASAFDDYPSFIFYDVDIEKNEEDIKNMSIKLGTQASMECGEEATFYSCGSIVLPYVDMKNYTINSNKNSEVRYITEEAIKAAKSINVNSNIHKSINNAFNSYVENIRRIDLELDNAIGLKVLTPIDQINREKILSYYFHQVVQAQLLYGYATGDIIEANLWTKIKRFFTGLFSSELQMPIRVLNINNTDELNISNRLKDGQAVSEVVQMLECMDDLTGLTSAKNASKKISGSGSSSVSTKCVNFDSDGYNKVLGLNSSGEINKPQTPEELEALNDYINDEIQRAEEIIRKQVNNIYLIKKGVMKSFNQSAKDISGHYSPDDEISGTENIENILIAARKKGWASAGSLMKSIIQEYESESKLQKGLLLGPYINVENLDESMVDKGIISGNYYPSLKSELNNTYNSFYNNTKVKNSEDLNVQKFIESYVDNKQEALQVDSVKSEGFIRAFIDSFSYVVKDFTTSMGITPSNNSDENKELTQMESCMQGMSSCGIPLIHPIQSVSKAGKDLLYTTASIYGIAIATDLGLWYHEERSNSSAKDAENANVKKKNAKAGKGNVISSIIDFSPVSIIMKVIDVFVKLALMLAAFMAYGVVLIPFFTFLMSLVGWVILVFQMLFISPVWITFLFQPKSQGENAEAIRAAYSVTAQLLLKPALLITAYLLAWWLMVIFIMVVNMTIGNFMVSVGENSELLLSITDTLFSFMFYCVILVTVISLAFKLISNLQDKTFAMIGVNPNKEDDSELQEQAKTFGKMLSTKLTYDLMTSNEKDIEKERNPIKRRREQAKQEYKDRNKRDQK